MKIVMETNSLILSIIVPIYNASKYLNRCINSILNQGLNENNYEVKTKRWINRQFFINMQ